MRLGCHNWLEEFSHVSYKERELLFAMRSIANASSSRKKEISSHVEKSLAFGDSFDPTVTSPTIPDAFRSLGTDEISASLHILLEAFYEIALCRKKGLPVNSSGTTGGSFNRDQFVRVFQKENNDQACPFCDGEMDGAKWITGCQGAFTQHCPAIQRTLFRRVVAVTVLRVESFPWLLLALDLSMNGSTHIKDLLMLIFWSR